MDEVIWQDLKFFGLVLSTIMISAAGYMINDYYDQKIDMINRPKKVIIGIDVKRRQVLLAHTLINLLGILIGFWVNPLVGLTHLFSAFFLWYYSNYLRRLPLMGNLTIALLTGMTFLIVLIYFRRQEQIVFFYALFAFIMGLIREVIKDIEDVKGEEAFGCITVPVIWGIRGAKITIYMILVVGIVLLLNFLIAEMNWPLRIYFLILTPLFIWFFISLVKADTQKHFSNLKAFCNYIILSGILSISLN